ncbi:MAG: transposase [Magnetococcales bacterium]|nr:transposase [Magnetococcales bacterium]
MVAEERRTTSILARCHGISSNTLSQWREEFITGGTKI